MLDSLSGISFSLWFLTGQVRSVRWLKEDLKAYLTYIDEAVVCDLPAGLKSQHVQSPRLLGGEVGESGVGDVVGLQVELVEGGEELRDGADALVGHVDAVVDGDGDEARVQRGPQALQECNSIYILGTPKL